jgi:hypothetical protein
MVVLNGSSLLLRCRRPARCAGAFRHLRIVLQPMCRCRAILWTGHRSDQYRRYKSLICSVESMGAILFIRRKRRVRQDVVVCKIAQTPLLVSNVLPLTIPFDSSPVLLAITLPVIRVPSAPLLRTVQAHLSIFRISSDLLAVIIGAPAPLAPRFAANRLCWLIFRGLEDSFAVAAAPFDHTGGCRTARTRLKNLETVVKSVPRPRRWPFFSATKQAEMNPFYIGADMHRFSLDAPPTEMEIRLMGVGGFLVNIGWSWMD